VREEDEGLELMPAGVSIRDFVPVELLGPIVVARELPEAADPAPEPGLTPGVPPIDIEPALADRTSLFGDLEAY
jgi:hypothetical protein